MTTAATIKELALSNEIKELDIEYIRIFSEEDKRQIIIKRCDLDSELRCEYCKKGKDTAKSIQSTLVNSGFEDSKAKKFIAHFLKLLIKFEQEQKQTQRDHILGQIRERRKKTNIKTVEQWKIELKGKYNTLKQVIEDNIPEIWIGLEFELSVLRILNIHGNTLPFIGIILARPGGGKTQILRVLGDWYCVYHIDDFSPNDPERNKTIDGMYNKQPTGRKKNLYRVHEPFLDDTTLQEFEVSMKSAMEINRYLQKMDKEVCPVRVFREGTGTDTKYRVQGLNLVENEIITHS